MGKFSMYPGSRSFGGHVSKLFAATIATAFILSLPVQAQEKSSDSAFAVGDSFSFDELSARMKAKAEEAYVAPKSALPDFMSDFDYDDYRNIQYDPDHARWKDDGSLFQVMAFHLGWLFKEPVHVFEVADGKVGDFGFSTSDFLYHNGLDQRIPADAVLPGVSGFKLTYPLNRPDIFDEVLVFQGASYFRALGRGNTYGLSARGLAINTGLSSGEEFPRFSEFYLEKQAPGATQVVVDAALDSPSVTGAYRFVIKPGSDTIMDVTARLYFRKDVEQIGIAPLTSMFLYAQNNRADFDDYRPQVHDSNGLRVVRENGDVLWRQLNNPPRLASSYLSETAPKSFGLFQRDRNFDDYEDAGAHYESRPSLNVEPIGDWGAGSVRLVEIPSDKEVNDNIVAFWVPEQAAKAGESREYKYRLNWGALAPEKNAGKAYVAATRTGEGGVSGVDNDANLRKFVVDFEGGTLARLPEDAELDLNVSATGGEVVHSTISKLSGTDKWRMVLDVKTTPGKVVELVAHVSGYGQRLSETWLYQWMTAQ